jgi:hypothetical protein
MAEQYHPRVFELVRHEDVSGASGEGVVATGVAWPDGTVAMQWRNEGNEGLTTNQNGLSIKPAPDGVEATVEIHGHGGATELRWVD